MREMLEPVFGESGAIVAQFFVILVFVLILVGVGYLIFSRYYSNALTGGSRGRGPRLGIIDSISVDNRRRLVLIRRDNVEHLLLIGSNTDLVVESAIARPAAPAGARPRQQAPRQQPPAMPQPQSHSQSQPQPQGSAQARPQPSSQPQRELSAPQPRASAAATQTAAEPAPTTPPRAQAPQTAAARPQAPGISEPIPFPQHRRPPARATSPAGEAAYSPANVERAAQQQPATPPRTSARETAAAAASLGTASTGNASVASASAHFEEPAHPTTVGPALARANTKAHDELAEGLAEDVETGLETQTRSEVADAMVTPPPSADDDDMPASAGAQDISSTEDAERAAAVSNLEEEMARLLGQITSKNDS